MLPLEHQVDSSSSEQEPREKNPSRRQLLKALIATGGAVTASTMLPGEWSKPVVEMGVLPAHAQVSPVPTATATPRPIYAIITCSASNAAGGGNIGTTDTITTYCEILPAIDGIQLRRTITLNQAGHPQDGVVAVDAGLTDASGRFQPPDFDLSTLSPTISSGTNRVSILWEFVDPADGTNTCQNLIDII